MDSAPELEFDEEQRAIVEALARFCAQHDVTAYARRADAPFPRELWRQLAQLGVFAAGAPGRGESGGLPAVCAICETLGEQLFPGPVADTYLAIQVLDGARAAALVTGQSLVSICRDARLLPLGPEADLFLLLDRQGIARAAAPTQMSEVATLGGETWGRARLRVEEPLGAGESAQVVGNIAGAAYLAGAAWRLLRDCAGHAATRTQFGRALGDFQAVAHPLADCAVALTAAQYLARAAAADPGCAPALAAAAALSARDAALRTAFACHQAFGAVGVTLAGPVFHFSRRIRQLASQLDNGHREQDALLHDGARGSG